MKYLLHCFPFCEFIHELVEVADLLHELVWHILYLVTTDVASYESTVQIESGECLIEEHLVQGDR